MKKTSRQVTFVAPIRLAFPTVWEPKPIMLAGRPKGDPKYSAGLVIPNSLTSVVQQLEQVEQEIVNEAWIGQGEIVPTDFHRIKAWGPQARPGDANLTDCWLINAYSNADSPPRIVKRNPADPSTFINIPAAEGRTLIYSGCECWVSIGFFAYESGIGAGLNLIMPTGRDVGRFDGIQTADAAFGHLPLDAGNIEPQGLPQPGQQQQQQQPWPPQQTQLGQPGQQQAPTQPAQPGQQMPGPDGLIW